jgi:hypothetical protein
MPSITPEVMRAFLREIEKTSAPITPIARRFIGGAAATGGAMGGAAGFLSGYNKAREEGQSRTQAIGSGFTRGLLGAGIGAGAGAGIGALGKFKLPWLGEVNPGQALHNFGGHALHQWTGYGKARDFGGATAQTEHYLQQAIQSGDQAAIANARKAHEAMQKAEEMGLTSLPGAVKAFATRPREAARAGWNAAIHGTTKGQKALMFGLPAALTGVSMLMPGQDAEGRARTLGSSLVSTVPMMLLPWNPASLTLAMAPAMAGLPDISPFSLVSSGAADVGGAVGGAVAKGVKAMTGSVAPPTNGQVASPGQQQQVGGVA